MNDRELIAQALAKSNQQNLPYSIAYDNFAEKDKDAYRRLADAVLAAIGDRIIPELPEWCDNLDVFLPPVGEPFAEYHVELIEGDGSGMYREGRGPTIPAAVRSALEAGQ